MTLQTIIKDLAQEEQRQHVEGLLDMGRSSGRVSAPGTAESSEAPLPIPAVALPASEQTRDAIHLLRNRSRSALVSAFVAAVRAAASSGLMRITQ